MLFSWGRGGLASEVRIGVNGVVGFLCRKGASPGRRRVVVAGGLRGEHFEPPLLLGRALTEYLVAGLLRPAGQLVGADQRVLPHAQNLSVVLCQFAQHHGRALGVRVSRHEVVDPPLLQLHQAGEQQRIIHAQLAGAVGESHAVEHGGLAGVHEPQVAQGGFLFTFGVLGGHEEHGVLVHGFEQIVDVRGA